MHEFVRAADSDVEDIVSLMEQYYAEDGYRFSESRARAAIIEFISNPSVGRLWVVTDGERSVGYLVVTLGYSFEYQGRDAFLDEVYVLPDQRGKGIGSRAMEIAEAACRELGVHALHLEVEREKSVAMDVYRRAGFEDHDRYLMTKLLR